MHTKKNRILIMVNEIFFKYADNKIVPAPIIVNMNHFLSLCLNPFVWSNLYVELDITNPIPIKNIILPTNKLSYSVTSPANAISKNIVFHIWFPNNCLIMVIFCLNPLIQ